MLASFGLMVRMVVLCLSSVSLYPGAQLTLWFVSWQERIGMWALPSVILNSYVKYMLGTCPHPLVKGVVGRGPLRKGFLTERTLTFPGPPSSGRMTSFKVLGELRHVSVYKVERKGRTAKWRQRVRGSVGEDSVPHPSPQPNWWAVASSVQMLKPLTVSVHPECQPG